jgi:hypothetical protein
MRPAILLLLTAFALFGASPAGATGGDTSNDWSCQNQGGSTSNSGTGLLTDTLSFGPTGFTVISDVYANQVLPDNTAAKVKGWAGAIAQQQTTAECESTLHADYTQRYLADYTNVFSKTGKFLVPWTLDWTGTNQGGDHASAGWTILVNGQTLGSGLVNIDSSGNPQQNGLGSGIVIEQLGPGTFRARGEGVVTDTLSLPITGTGDIQIIDVQVLVNVRAKLPPGASNVTATSSLGTGLNFKLASVNPTLVLSSTPNAAATRTPQTKPQQACIKALNKQAAKLTQTTGKEIAYCIQQRLAGKDQNLGPLQDLDHCIAIQTDVRGKKGQQLVKADAGISKKCFQNVAEQFPDFAQPPTIGGFIVSTIGEPVTGTADFFNNDLNTLIQPTQVQKDDGKCQLEVVKGYQRVIDTWLKEAFKAKSAAIAGKKKTVPAGVADDLTRQVTWGVEDSKKLEKKLATLRKGVGKQCQMSSLSAIVPGCGANTTAELAACAAEEALCRACNDFNGVDDTSVDCDLLDNNLPDHSCHGH